MDIDDIAPTPKARGKYEDVNPFTQGYEACKAGLPPTDNPYSEEEEKTMWYNGFVSYVQGLAK